MNIYNRKEIAVMAYVAGLLTGMVVAFAACTPDPVVVDGYTTGVRQ